ncbi:sensor histidine kinase [Amycolatopsis taiwanensis]|uniref:histidine kinase n=1 Tax=Amycolatopsis taiwanensis TaxID=342230 RepID=A0A9W6R1R7_9PSEU|nr:histidine kinase [Amycolatopsis taiwanensis]GLY65950.1 two-component sensor histidine kinase [Amycolatopsis taiwanensis]
MRKGIGKSVVAAYRALPAWRQDGVIAVVTFMVVLAIYFTGTYRLAPGADRAGLWVRLVELVALCGAQLLRRRVPGGILLATAVLAADLALGASLPIVVVYTDFLYAATLYGSRLASRIMVGIAAVAVVFLLAVTVLLARSSEGTVPAALGLLSLVMVPVWWAMNVRGQREVADSERDRANQVARIAELDRRAAVAAERARMARDLHDIVAGHLSAIAIQSEAVLSMDGDPRTTRSVLTAVRENSLSALDEMRAMIDLLRVGLGPGEAEAETTAPPRLADLSRLVQSAEAAGTAVAVRSTLDIGVPAAVDLAAYRIVQEALTNAVKHAPDARVEVDIGLRDGSLTVAVDNELVGHAAPVGDCGHGLSTMRERAGLVGGTLTAGPGGRGWLVRAEFPVKKGRA